MRKAIALFAMALIVSLCTGSASAQNDWAGKFEITMLGGFNFVMEQDGDEDITVIGIPHGAAGVDYTAFPAFRFTFWLDAPVQLDGGFSYVSYSRDEHDYSLINLEGGVSTNIKTKSGKVAPFIGGFAGLLSASNGNTQTELYLGGQAGARIPIRDYAAVRFQVAYRHMLGDDFDFNVLEIAGGLSFFL